MSEPAIESRRSVGWNASVLALAAVSVLAAFPSAEAAPSRQASASQATLDQYCVGCHGGQTPRAGLALDTLGDGLATGGVSAHPEAWEKVIRKLRGGMMPPLGAARPDNATLDGLAAWLETSLDSASRLTPDPGRAPIHRLNRTEYANAIRDLLDLEIDGSEFLPPDTESHGFDNIADALTTSPSLLEQYLTASRKVTALAVGDPDARVVSQIYRVPPDRVQEEHIEGLPLGTRGGILIRHNFPLDAEYQFSVFLLRNIVGYMKGLEWPHELEITIDSERVFLAPVGGDADNEMSDANFAAAADTIDERLKTRIPVSAGPHEIGVAFIRRNSAESHEPLEPHTRDHDLQNMNGVPLLDYVDITGPFDATGPGETPSRDRIFSCYPTSPAEETPCAGAVLGDLVRRAYRRPVSADELDQVMGFYEDGRRGGTFETGIQAGLRFVLASPNFIFRSEPDPAGIPPGTVYPLEPLALASRLSFFLWSSIPDDALLEAAVSGDLRDPALLEAQVLRMLRDPRSEALIENFAGQWLLLRNLQSVTPDTLLFPDFDDNLRRAFRRETELLVGSVLREDRPVIDLIDADYTFVNDRLGAHYGIPNVYGSHFRRVALTDDSRRGLLGQGSILTVTSYPNRTSPVLRGKFILENLMGTPPPAPPPDVPDLEENAPGQAARSLRERLEEHRANPTCASCHAVMDPLGLALENFDAIGGFRTMEPGGQVDASGQLADGTPVEGPATLREALLERPGQFATTLTEKLLTYALGRGLEHSDMPVVRSIVARAADDDYRMSSIMMGIIGSTPFAMKRAGAEIPPAQTAAAGPE
jgi:mono/diheme cytochrome c family protein